MKRPGRFFATLVALPALVSLGACASARTSKPEIPVEPQVVQATVRFHKEYVLAPGDKIEVVVQRSPEVSRSVTIRPDGHISLPLLQDVPAAGLTVPELDSQLTELFSKRFTASEVKVIANTVRQPMVYVIGDVTTPTPVPLRDAPTAMQAITHAGGFRRSASMRDIAIIRLAEDGILRAMLVPVSSPGQPGPYMALRVAPLQPDDLIFVPESGRSQMTRFIDDFVNRPLTGINSLFFTYVNFRLV